jgi:predicted HicB family RNase H-like nuclease
MIPKKPQPMAKADYEATAERFLTGSNAGDKTKKTKDYRYYNLPLPKQLHAKAKGIAAALDISLQEYIIMAIEHENQARS